MRAEQAIFTSMTRDGRAGYHVVARSPGVAEADAVALATWSPSHGSLIVDAANRTSLNFHPLPTGRLAVSRTCEGPAEYSGRGERQVYTHALILDANDVWSAGGPVAVYRDALALGHLLYRPEPEPVLAAIELGSLHVQDDPAAWVARARVLGLPEPSRMAMQLRSGEPVALRHAGDRVALAECLVGLLPQELKELASFSTSLRPSAVRPYRISLVN